jgi:hypothetical protein
MSFRDLPELWDEKGALTILSDDNYEKPVSQEPVALLCLNGTSRSEHLVHHWG